MSATYIPFTDEHKSIANLTDITDFLITQGEEVIKVGTKEYNWKPHGSSRISGNKWVHNSSRESGYPVKFLQHFMGYSYQDAMLTLLGFNGVDIHNDIKHNEKPVSKNSQTSRKRAITPENRPFTLPPRDENMKRVFAYLLKTRHIPSDIVSFFAHEQKMYQAGKSHYQNIVFVGHNEENDPVYATKRSPSEQVKFRGDVTGSNKREYCFNYFPEQAKEPKQASGSLYVYEAPIDMMSHIAFIKEIPRNDGFSWQNDSFIALGGTADNPLFHYLKNKSEIENVPDKIILALDKDNAGINATTDILLKLAKEYPKIDVDVQLPNFKDWNEDLTARAISDLKYGDVCMMPNPISNALKIFYSAEAMVYKMAEDKHISEITGRLVPSFFVLDENSGGALRKFLNERYRSEQPVQEISFFSSGHEPKQWCDEIAGLIDKAEKVGVKTSVFDYNVGELHYNLLNVVYTKPNDLHVSDNHSPEKVIHQAFS